ncbi:hypothetical protein V6Z11_D04G220600 [Gossypium hirsutum]
MEDIGEPEKLVESITYMDVPLYKAAAEGKIEEFDNCQGLNLESLKTPNYDNVLHVNLANSERTASAWSFKSRSRRSNRSDFVKKILGECPLLLLQANRKGQTPLHIAARYGRSTTVKLFIESRANGDIENLGMDELEAVREMLRLKDEESNTALHVAARYGHVGVVQALLELEDPDFPYSVNKNHETPLYLASKGGYWRSVTILLDKWKSTVHGGPYGRTALHAAVMSGDVETTKIILKVKGDLTKETDENGHTPLHYAAHLGYNPIVEKLLKRDVSAAYIGDKKWEMTPLLMAARQGHERTEQIVKLVKDIVVNEEVAEEAVDSVPSPTVMGNDLEKRLSLEKARDTQLVVAALVATVTFAAAITVPGGFKGEKEIDQGTPFLIHKAAFQTFISRSRDKIGFNITSASPFLGYAMYAMMIAFCTAVYVMLKPSHGLAITSCSLGLSSFFFYFLKGVFDGFLESSRKNEV